MIKETRKNTKFIGIDASKVVAKINKEFQKNKPKEKERKDFVLPFYFKD